MGFQRLLNMVIRFNVCRVVQVAALQQPFQFVNAFFGKCHAAMLLINGVVTREILFAGFLAFNYFATNQLWNHTI